MFVVLLILLFCSFCPVVSFPGASVSALCELKAGSYIVLPCTFSAKMNGKFNLDVYSETVKVNLTA
jgi:hypothetical protein